MSVDWDNLNVGNPSLDTSEYFFVQSHRREHERAPEMWNVNEKENQPRSAIKHQASLNNKVSKASEVTNATDMKKPPPRPLATKSFVKAKNAPPPPAAAGALRVCQYTRIYELKKQNLIKKLIDEEKRRPVFHSQPAPNFKALHSKVVAKKTTTVTIPTTPQCLKNSNDMEARRKLKLQQIMDDKEKAEQQAKLVQQRPPRVLNNAPFRPKKLEKAPVKTEPFQLTSNYRLEARKKFNEENQKRIEERKKLEEQQRKQRDIELAREMRKKATFKANPNPFK